VRARAVVAVAVGGSLLAGLGLSGLWIWRALHPPALLRLVYGPDRHGELRGDAVERALAVVRARAAALGPNVRVTRSGEEISVDLPAVAPEALAAFRRLMRLDVRLELRLVDDDSDLVRRLVGRLPPPAGIALRERVRDRGGRSLRHAVLVGRNLDRLKGYLGRLPPDLRPPDRELRIGEGLAESGRETEFELYLVHRHAALTGEHVREARVLFDDATGVPDVGVTFSPEGARRFEALTRAHVGQRVAILLNDKVSSAPVIVAPISGGQARITLGGWRERAALLVEARDLATVLESGTLPFRLELRRELLLAPRRGH